MDLSNLFYVTAANVAIGSVIEPGNFGRVINAYRRNAGDPWVLARELAFELVRVQDYAHLPSRLNCSFVFTSHDGASAGFQHLANGGLLAHRMFRVELVDETAPMHVGDFSVIQMPPQEFLYPMMLVAKRYWAGETLQHPELLTTSALRIVECVLDDPGGYRRLPAKEAI